MKDNIPKKSLDYQYDLNALDMLEVDKAKKDFNKNVMKDGQQSNALLELRIQELEIKLQQVKEEKNNLDFAYKDEKQRNKELVQSMSNYNALVDEHLARVVIELECFEKENNTFIDKILAKIKARQLMKKTHDLQSDLKETANET